MKVGELAAIAARIFAICLFLHSLHQFSGLAGYVGPYSPDGLTIPLMYFLVAVLAPMVAAILIWMFPVAISRAVLPNIESEEIKISNGNTFFPAALIILGVYILTYAVPALLFLITRTYIAWRSERVGVGFSNTETIAHLITIIFEIFIALWLIFGYSGVRNLIFRIRGREL